MNGSNFKYGFQTETWYFSELAKAGAAAKEEKLKLPGPQFPRTPTKLWTGESSHTYPLTNL